MTRATAIRRSLVGALLMLVCAAAFAAVALAAKPAHGRHFTGRTGVNAIEGFFAPVSFTVSQNGSSLQGFTFATLGCFGSGGFQPGVNPYGKGTTVPVKTVKVSSSGRVSASGAKSKYSSGGVTTTTTAAITGHFTKSRALTGSITFSQKLSGKFSSSCGPAKITFTASAH